MYDTQRQRPSKLHARHGYINKGMMKSQPKNMEVRRGVELSLERGSLSGQDSRMGSF